MQVKQEQYDNYIVLIEKFKKKCPPGVAQEEYDSFLNLEYCKIVYNFFQKHERNQIKQNIEHYVNAALKKAIKYKYYAKNKRTKKSIAFSFIDSTMFEAEIDKIEGKIDHRYYKKMKNESIIMNDPKLTELFISENVGWIDLKNDLFTGLNLRHICFVILNIQGITFKRIAHDFECSVKTVERIIRAAKEIITINAHRLGYKRWE